MATTVHDTPLQGRPPKYKPEYCEMLIDHMSSGLSYETFSAVIGTHRSVLYNWEKMHPDFLDAKKKAVEASQAFWEKIGLAQAVGDKQYGKGNTASWIFNMKNRFNWADKQEVSNPDDNRRSFKLAYAVDEDIIEAEVVRKEIEPSKEDSE
jgi:hypothetical protein